MATPPPSTLAVHPFRTKALEIGNGPLALWVSDDYNAGTGQIPDATGNEHHLTVTGAVTDEAETPPPSFKTPLYLDGVDDRLVSPAGTWLDLAGDFYLLAVCRPATDSPPDWTAMVERGDRWFGLRFESNAGGDFGSFVRDASGTPVERAVSPAGSGGLPPPTWVTSQEASGQVEVQVDAADPLPEVPMTGWNLWVCRVDANRPRLDRGYTEAAANDVAVTPGGPDVGLSFFAQQHSSTFEWRRFLEGWFVAGAVYDHIPTLAERIALTEAMQEPFSEDEPPVVSSGVRLTATTSLTVASPQTSRSYTLGPYLLDDVARYGESRIEWDADTPAGTSLRVEASWNGFQWRDVANRQEIPGMGVGRALSGRSLWLRFTLISEDGETTPTVRDVHVSVRPTETTEMVPLGTYNISDVEVDDSSDQLRIKVKGFDRSRRLKLNRWADAWVVEKGTNVGDAVRAIILDRDPDAKVSIAATGRTTPLAVFGEDREENDPLRDAESLASAIGYELFVDAHDFYVFRPKPTADVDAPRWLFTEEIGDFDGNLLDLTRDDSDERAYNHVIVLGESPDGDPIRVDVADEDEDSPTYIGDPWGSSDFGDRPYWMASSLISDEDQATAAATARLHEVSTVVRSIGVTAIPNPAVDVGDVAHVLRRRSRVDGYYVVERVTHPLSPQQVMNVAMRERRA